jgi:hypothetical protein
MSMNLRNAVTNDEEAVIFLIEGVLTDLHVEAGTENLLKKIDQHYRSKSVLTGMGAAAGDLFGQAANAAMLAMYDGESTQNFACLIDGQVLCGQFAGAQLLEEGSRVRVAASRSGNVIVARGILDEKQGLVWIEHAWGKRAEANENWKLAAWTFLAANVCWAVAYLFVADNVGFIESQSWGVLSIGVVCFCVALWANRDMQLLASSSTEVFRLLGFSEPERVNLNNHLLYGVVTFGPMENRKNRPLVAEMSPDELRNVYDYKQAVEDGKLSMMM